jgi:hypothetical protein
MDVISIERIQQEAREAAQRYTHMNDACPYPFDTMAAALFRQEFTAQRLRLAAENAQK